MNIIVIGAGIGGLATALSIARKTTYHVTVLEASSSLSEAGAGIQITSNASRILHQWDLGHIFEEYATIPDFMEVRSYKVNEIIGLVAANKRDYAARVWGSPHWLIHRVRYQEILAEATATMGRVTIKFDSRVARLDVEDRKIVMVDGSAILADLIIGADGIHSRTRRSIPSLESIEPIQAVNYCYRTLIPRERMMGNFQTAAIIQNHNQLSWAGHNKHIIGYPLERGSVYNLVLVIPDRSTTAPLATYNQPASVEEMCAEFADWHPAITTMLSLAESCTKWTIAELPPLPSWSSNDGHVVLLGDSAHAMTPHAASGAATALEDAEVLGQCIANCSAPEELAAAMELYEIIRKGRCERIQEISRQNATTFSMPDGKDQEARDAKFAQARKALEAQLEGLVEPVKPRPDISKSFPHPELMMWLYGYDAAEEVRAYLKDSKKPG